MPVSAETGENVDRLEQAFLDHLPEGEPLYPDGLPDRPAGTVLRGRDSCASRCCGTRTHELPYTTAVVVDKFEEPDERA